MVCDFCKNAKTKVIDSRYFYDPKDGKNYVERRRKCTACEETFTTVEKRT